VESGAQQLSRRVGVIVWPKELDATVATDRLELGRKKV